VKRFLSVSLLGLSLASIVWLLIEPSLAYAEPTVPVVTINTSSGAEVQSSEVFGGLKLVALLTAMIFLPSLLMSGTCFTRIIIILGLTRQALGTAQTPPNQVIIGIGMFLTFAIMGPVFEEIYEDALVPYSEDQIGHSEAASLAFAPLKRFMLAHTREQDLALFIEVHHEEPPESPEDLGPLVIVPAFLLSELNTAYQIAFLIYLPFLILDMVISSVLTSMSMITLPPTVISLPIKLMLFVVIDGWHLIIGNLIRSYHV
jgi:flagellar biosynthetic protein FliP